MADEPDFFSAVAALGRVETLDEDALRLLIRVERAGEDFYAALADRLGNDEAAALFRRNGREERGHAERMRKALAIKLGRDVDSLPEDSASWPIELPDAIPLEMLAGIVQAEIDGDAGYQRWADREGDPEVQRLLRLNGREETVHGERVTRALEILRAAAGA